MPAKDNKMPEPYLPPEATREAYWYYSGALGGAGGRATASTYMERATVGNTLTLRRLPPAGRPCRKVAAKLRAPAFMDDARARAVAHVECM